MGLPRQQIHLGLIWATFVTYGSVTAQVSVILAKFGSRIHKLGLTMTMLMTPKANDASKTQ